jgi:UDP-N-acetyl-2-amino-2-deoxyglucuronate dehydrogenase
MEKTRFALVGCGNIAKKHTHVIQKCLDNAQIVAFCNVMYERAQEFAQRTNAQAFSSIRDMMQSVGEDIDIVNILTPSGLHANNVFELVEYGKPLVVEKPIALRLDEADRIIRACDAYGVKIFVVHQNRYNVPIIRAYEALERGRFGKLVMGTVRLR